MKVLVFDEYIGPLPWSPGAWTIEIARGLALRGHEVTVACDNAFDPAALAPARVLVRNPERRGEDRQPLAFRRWAIRTARMIGAEVSLSLTHAAPADFFLPIGPTSLGEFALVWRTQPPLSAAFETVQRSWLPAAAIADALGGGARRLAFAESTEGRTGLGYASRFDPPGPAALADLRSRTRVLLGIDAARPVILVSAVHAERHGLAPMLEGFRLLRPERSAGAPVLLAAGESAYTIHSAAVAAGCEGALRAVGATARMDALLAACDVAAAPLAGAARSCAGRFIADALRMGRPVLAERAACGAELLLGTGPPATRAGVVLDTARASIWRGAFEKALSEPWRARAAAAAAAIGRGLGMGEFLSRLEAALAAPRAETAAARPAASSAAG